MRRVPQFLTWWLPDPVRVWHMIVYPAVAMPVLIALARFVDDRFAGGLEGAARDAYQLGRGALIAGLMAGLIASLAIRYRSRYERQLRSTSDFLASVIESSGEGIVARDARGRVVSWNPAAEAIFGWTSEEMLGEPCDRWVPDDEAARASDARLERAAIEGETLHDFETVRLRKDGSTVVVRITQAPRRDADGHLEGSTAIVRDVSLFKEMEQRLVARERLAAVGELAATVAHEVKNPLAGIRGACEMLRDGFEPEDPRSELIVEVMRQIDRLGRTVSDVLAFARPKAIDLEPTRINDLLGRMLDGVARDEAHRRVAFVRELDTTLDYVYVDPRHVEQAALNLVLNAAQAAGPTGRVTIATRREGEHVEISVEDDGPGIAVDARADVFKPFFTTKTRGTGLGLAIVERVAKAHGGEVEFRSSPGEGTRFTMRFPVVSA